MTEQPSTEVAPSEPPAANSSNSVQSQRQPFSAGFQFSELSLLLAILMPLAFLVLAIIEFIGSLWRPIAVVLYVLVLAAGMVTLLGNRINRDKAKPDNAESDVSVVIVFGLFVIVGFSQLGRHLSLWLGGFTASQSGYWHWLRFGMANVLESVLLDTPAVFNWNLTEIQGVTFWARTLVFLFRTSIEFFVVAELIHVIGFAKKAWKRGPTTQHKHYPGLMFSKLGGLVVLAIWAIPLSFGIGAVVNDGWSLASAIAAFKLGSPVMLGVWFAWQNIRALFSVNGWGNRLLALLGLALGVWLAIKNWPDLVVFMGY